MNSITPKIGECKIENGTITDYKWNGLAWILSSKKITYDNKNIYQKNLYTFKKNKYSRSVFYDNVKNVVGEPNWDLCRPSNILNN